MLFRFAALQSETGKALLQKNGITGEPVSTLVYLCNGNCFIQSTAIIHILRDLGGIWKCFYPLIYLPLPIRDAIYAFIARNRYSFFGKRNQCMMPTSELKDRFYS